MHRSLCLLALLFVACHPAQPREIISASGDFQPLVEGTNDFAFDVWSASRTLAPDNIFFSPFSMAAALSMLYGGAQGTTETQLATALSVPDGGEGAWHTSMGALLADLGGEHYRPYTLEVANRLFGQEGYPWAESYLALTGDTYGAELQPVDFGADPEGARDEVNGWVADITRDRVPELFESGAFDATTRLVLANAIYFLGDWANAFDAEDTRNTAFQLASGETVDVPMMAQTADHRYFAQDDLQVAQLSYDGGEISMVFVLPTAADGLSALEDTLTADEMNRLLSDVVEQEVYVQIPSFQLSAEFPLYESLLALGVTDVFDDNLSDLSGMATVEDLYVDSVVHKAFVRVDEEGTEAAAATGVEVGTRTAAGDPAQFIADHPFLFFIRDDLTGTILFAGRMVDPSLAPITE